MDAVNSIGVGSLQHNTCILHIGGVSMVIKVLQPGLRTFLYYSVRKSKTLHLCMICNVSYGIYSFVDVHHQFCIICYELQCVLHVTNLQSVQYITNLQNIQYVTNLQNV